MLFFVAALLTVAGAVSTYIGVGLARSEERRRGYLECEERLDILRRQIRRLRPK
jgi:hypothetical protein